MADCLLFVYGTLQPEFFPPKTMKDANRDHAPGTLFDLGDYPVAVLGVSEEPSAWFQGQVLTIDCAELAELDDYEGVAEGYYHRSPVVLRSGRQAWIYYYQLPLPPNALQIDHWNGDKNTCTSY